MDIASFDAIVRDAKVKRPMWFAGESEPLATDDAIAMAQAELGAVLPEEYKQFILRYGGGYFGLTNVFSVNKHGHWFIAAKKELLSPGVPLGVPFIPVTDDETGGYYGFICSEGKCGEEVYYFHPDEMDAPTPKYHSFLAYVAKVGLNV